MLHEHHRDHHEFPDTTSIAGSLKQSSSLYSLERFSRPSSHYLQAGTALLNEAANSMPEERPVLIGVIVIGILCAAGLFFEYLQ